MKITKCENRFEVIADDLESEEAEIVLGEIYKWVVDKIPDEDDQYMAALGPCGK
jgi:hypothetical protein